MLPKYFLFFIIVLCIVTSQSCISNSEDYETDYKAFNSPITVLAKIRKVGKSEHSVQITAVYKINHGNLTKGDKINVGSITKDPGCPVMKKKKEMIFYLEHKIPTKDYYEIKFNPELISKKTKKGLPKFMCAGCVQPAKFPKKIKATERIKQGEKYKLTCKAKGKPKPTMKIWKDDVPLSSSKGVKVGISKKGGRVTVKFSKFSDKNVGVYTCQASNAMGSINMTKQLLIDLCQTCSKENENFCVHGSCCFRADLNESLCVCDKGYTGLRCKIRELNHGNPKIGAASFDRKIIAIMGLVLAIIFCCIILYVVYRKSKKPRSKRRPRPNRSNAGVDAELLNVRPGGQNNSSSFAQHPNSYEPVTVPSVPSNQDTQGLLGQDQRDSPNGSANGEIRRNRLNGNSSTQRPTPKHQKLDDEIPCMAMPGEIISGQKVPSNFSSTESMVEGENKHTLDPDHGIIGHTELPQNFDHIISQNSYTPPTYISVGQNADTPDGQEAVSPSSPHRVTTFENDGQVKETTVERVQGVTPHSPKMSPQQLQRQNRVYSRENSEPTSHKSDNNNTFSTFGSTSYNPNDNISYENTNLSYMPKPHSATLSDDDEFDGDDEMKQPLYKSVTSAQAHQIPLNSATKHVLPTPLPLSSSSDNQSLPDSDIDSQNRSINV